MGRAYFIAAGVGLALCIAFPVLLPFVLAGIVAGLLPYVLQRFRERPPLAQAPAHLHSFPRWITIAAAIASLVALFGLGTAFFSVLPEGGPSSPARRQALIVEVPVRYEGTGAFEDDPEQLALDDRLIVSFADLRDAAENYRLAREFELPARPEAPRPSRAQETISPAALQRILTAKLKAEGWELMPPSTRGDSFAKSRRVPLHSRIFPIDTGNEVQLPRFSEDTTGKGVLLDLYFAEGSEMVLTAPTRTFDSTRPTSSREELLAKDLEERRLELAPSSNVEVTVRSPWFRSGIVSSLANWILSSGKYLIGILLGLLIAVLSEPVKEWIRRRLKIPKGTN